MPSAFKGNKTLDYYMAYHDPSQSAFTPAKRRYSVWGPIAATTVGRAISKFWKEVMDDEQWGKDDIVLIGAMPSPNDVTRLEDDGDDPAGEDSVVEDEDDEGDEYEGDIEEEDEDDE